MITVPPIVPIETTLAEPTLNQPCTCAGERAPASTDLSGHAELYADVLRLHAMMAGGMGQWAASALVWGAA